MVVPCLGCSWRNARYLPVGRSQAGDRHFKFHDERDNLLIRGKAVVCNSADTEFLAINRAESRFTLMCLAPRDF